MKNLAFRLALAGLMLVVITGGTAFAATYSGTSQSYFNGQSDYNQVGYSYGDPQVTTNQYLDWNIFLENRLTRTIGAQVGAFGINRATYYYEGFDSPTTSIQDLSAGGHLGGIHEGRVTASSGNYAIIEGHSYWDGGYSYTLTFSIGGGAGTEKRFHF